MAEHLAEVAALVLGMAAAGQLLDGMEEQAFDFSEEQALDRAVARAQALAAVARALDGSMSQAHFGALLWTRIGAVWQAFDDDSAARHGVDALAALSMARPR
jgi:hypothetical protein